MKTHYLFDVDGTLTKPRSRMTEEMKDSLLEWSTTHTFSIVSGSDLSKIQEQVDPQVLEVSTYIFSCSGNECWEYARENLPNDPLASYGDFVPYLIYAKSFDLSKPLEDYLHFERKHSSWHGPKFEKNFELRTGMLNFSILGREATEEWRNKYEEWSSHDGDRQRIVNYINERFPEYEASIGGQISIDIVMRGFHKGQVVNRFDLSKTWIEFYGDKITNGNDRPLAERINELGCGFACQVSGPDELARLLFEEEKEEVGEVF